MPRDRDIGGAMTPSEIAQFVGRTHFESVRKLLSTPWRTARAPEVIADEVVAATIEAEWSARQRTGAPDDVSPAKALAFLPDPPAGWAPTALPAEKGVLKYYDCFAQHFRSEHEKPHSKFEGLLPQVRVSLPQQPPPADGLLAQTAIGNVFAQDHLLTSVAAVRDRMNQTFGGGFNDVTRVDVISPARLGGRFGAIGLYLGYRNHGTLPSFYLLEAGLATGPAVRLYPVRDMGKIIKAPTAYLPTPFVELSNTYDGQLIMNGDEPDTLIVQSYREPRTGIEARIKVTVMYQPRTAATVTKLNPGDITLSAAERIAVIGKALGEQAIDLQDLLADAGDTLPWLKKPV
jgi:hypothetical protein